MELYCEVVARNRAENLVNDSNIGPLIVVYGRVKLRNEVLVGAL